MKPLTLCLCVLDEVIFAYQSSDWQNWTGINIKGETGYHHQHKITNMASVIDECNQALNQDNNLSDVNVCVIYAQKHAQFALELLKTANDKFGNTAFICRPLEQIFQYYSEQNNGKNTPKLEKLGNEWIESHLLPLLGFDNSWKSAQKRLADIKQKEVSLINEQKLSESNFVKTKIAQEQQQQDLEQKINDKKQELAMVLAPNLESLLSFLPSIFKNFWNTVRPDELANIAGLLTVPEIKSPYLNPSNQMVQSKKRQFLALSDDEKQQIIGFCILLKKDFDLTVHLEFQSLIGDLD